MRRLSRSIGSIILGNNHASICNNHMIQHALEVLETGFRLVIRDLVAGLVYPGEGEVSVFTDLAVLDAVDEEGRVARGAEGSGACEVDGERDGFAAEPVADVVCVAVEERDADAVGENLLEVLDEVGEDKIAGLLEPARHVARVGAGVVDVYANGFLSRREVQKVYEVVLWRGVIVGVPDVVYASAAKHIVWLLNQ